MKIMYLCNCLIPKVAEHMNVGAGVFGGWLSETINAFAKDNEVVFMCPYKESVSVDIDDHFTFVGFTTKETETFFEKKLNQYKPDVIHIWGSEFKHSYYMSEALKKIKIEKKAVLSLQGIISEIAKVYDYGVPDRIVKRWTLGDIARKINIEGEKRVFKERGEFEIKTLKNLKNVIGRTQWDKETIKSINHDLNYYNCGESLRDNFYDGVKWEYDKCLKGRVFICQSSYPIKGFHLALPILAKVKEKYPYLTIATTGKTFTPHTLIGRLKQSSYQKYISKLIKKFNLENSIEYLGTLNSEGVKRELLKCNLLLSPSVIENSPNSIGEAMILGVPVVASDVGGVSSIISEKEGDLYDIKDSSTCVQYVENVLMYNDFQKSDMAVKRAQKQYDVLSIKNTLEKIYEDLAYAK